MIAEGLIAASVALAVIYSVRGMMRRSMPANRIDVLLVLLLLVLVLASLILNNRERAAIGLTEYGLLLMALVLMLISAMQMRRGRSVGNAGIRTRGLMGVGAGMLLLMMALLVPAMLAAINLPGQIAVLPTLTPGPTPSMNAVALDVFDRVVDSIARQTGQDPVAIATALDEGVTVGRLVRQHNGDLETVIQEITAVMTEQVQWLAAQERMNANQAAVAISAMETVVRLGVESNLNGLLARFESDPRERESAGGS